MTKPSAGTRSVTMPDSMLAASVCYRGPGPCCWIFSTTDFEKGFIRAETISYADYIQYKGEPGAKEAGKWRLEGKEYIVKEGDVLHFRFNV